MIAVALSIRIGAALDAMRNVGAMVRAGNFVSRAGTPRGRPSPALLDVDTQTRRVPPFSPIFARVKRSLWAYSRACGGQCLRHTVHGVTAIQRWTRREVARSACVGFGRAFSAQTSDRR